jgi:UDP-N-acetylbacillosamine N-acetyltransferase
MSLRRVVLWGASGHARVIADILRAAGGYALEGFIEDVHPERKGEVLCGARVLGGREALPRLAAEGVEMIVAIGDCAARLACADRAGAAGVAFATAVHPAAVLAGDVRPGCGTVVMAGAVVNAAAQLGRHAIVNSGAVVEHDCVIEDGVHISPGACLAGGVRVGRGAWVGIGAVVVEKVSIGAGSVIGAGAVVTKDVPGGVVAWGCPARVMRQAEAIP